MSLHHFARGAIAAENARRAMALRGFTPNGHPLWGPPETHNLRFGHPDYDAVMALNIRRTRPAHHSKAGRMGITKPRAREWDPNELFKLHRLYPKATKQELLSALPGRTWTAICRRARVDGYRRPRAAYKETGHVALDQILLRAMERNISLRELDAETQSKSYFSRRKWRGRQLNLAYVARAAAFLGGRLRVRWHQEAA